MICFNVLSDGDVDDKEDTEEEDDDQREDDDCPNVDQ